MTKRALEGSGRTLLTTLAAVIGMLVGLRAALAVSLAGPVTLLHPAPIPVETLGIQWTDLALWPADVQQFGVERLLHALAGLTLAVAAAATLNVVLLLVEDSASRRSEIAVRAAVGASPLALAVMLAREVRTLTLAAATLGVTAGVLAGAALRLSWPGGLEAVLARPPLDVLAAVTLVVVLVVVAHAGAALGGIRRGRAAVTLRSGGRATWDPAAVFVRRALGALHVSVAATVLVNAWALVSVAHPAADIAGREDVWVSRVEAADPTQWAGLSEALAEVPGLAAESLAAPGALVGLGIRDITITECGQCSIGGLPAPLWNATSEHHAVSAGFFDLAGIDLLEGRALAPGDDAGAPLVAVVSRRLANVAFENGEPLGRRLRIGGDIETWYTVVGVVEDYSAPGPGEDGTPRGAVYLSALQRPPRAGRVMLRGSPEAVEQAHAVLTDSGFDAPEPVTLVAFLRQEAAPLGWAAGAMRMLALLAFAAAIHGIWLTALQTTRRRAAELAVRRALGASTLATARLVLASRLRTTGWGLAGFLFFGTLASGTLQRAAGVDGPGAPGFAAVGLLLLAVSLLASARAVSEALAVEPARLLD